MMPNEHVLTDWNQLFSVVREIQTSFPESPLWFRGHTNPTFKLIPTVFRTGAGSATQIERRAFEVFEKFAARFSLEQENDWHTLINMQHYGIPTRLLDWTSSLGIAVFFATSNYRPSREDHNPFAIYVLAPYALNALSGRPEIYDSRSQYYGYKSIYWENKPFAPANPIALESPFVNNRVFAQQGLFTVHCSDTPLESNAASALHKIVLDSSCLQAAREFLHHANINEVTVFPDIQGLVAYVRSQM